MRFSDQIGALNQAVMDSLGVDVCINDGHMIKTVRARLVQEPSPVAGLDGQKPMPYLDVIADDVGCLAIRSGNGVVIGEQAFEVVRRDPAHRGRLKIYLRRSA